ncbi:MAG: hypothetical protein HFH23_17715 [Ruminococcus sp.]|nr:hypothetical protein [Ruminococcus sp.]
MVSYARSTYEKSRRFHEMLKELQKTISPVMIRTYLAAANKQKDDDVELSLNINEEQKARLDELNKLRMDGIRSEMKYALAQAEKNGIQLSEQVVSGRAILPGFKRELLDKVPSLGVYDLFIPFTEEELITCCK